MKRKTAFYITGALLLAGGMAATAHAATDPMIEGAKQCTHLLPQYEKQYGIPKHLLSAIATTESGRYHEGLKLSIPWPWTINAAGRSYYLDSKQEAIAMVQKLQRQGVASIDVGCMQVNLYHHPDAFSSLDKAFDPKTNIAYAASFLNNLYQDRKSWKRAAADYHSKEPERGGKYAGRVYNSWLQLVDKLKLAQVKVPENSLAEMRRMKPVAAAKGVKYASLAPAAGQIAVRSVAPLPEQVGKLVPSYQPPRMKSISINDSGVHKENTLVMHSEMKAVASALPPVADTNFIRINAEQPAEIPKNGPNFIFND